VSRGWPASAAAATAALALALALAGCGGGGDDAESSSDPAATVTTFTKAFASGDGAQACEQLTTEARDAFVKRAATATGSKDCATSMKRVHDLAGSSVTGPFAAATVSDVKITGSTATAKLTAAGHSTVVRLSKEDESWKLAGVPGI
jgi:hypothetical protein